jgi:PPOX class probable FMN-dependent enzyme
VNFAERLRTLPAIHHLAALALLDEHGQVVATIENRPGQAGSLAVYHALARRHGGRITPEAARLGLDWYAEHTADARAHPGRHPNIDRLLAWAQGEASYAVREIPAAPPAHAIMTREALRALYPPVRERSAKKEIPVLDAHARRLIALSPLVVVASADTSGEADASPRGGDPGFVKVLDEHTLVLPDAPGNNRLDTLGNVVGHGVGGAPLGLLFLVPGLDETLRVNGRAWLTTDPALCALAADARRVPRAVLRVHVQACYLHCGKAFIMRARAWDPATHVDPSTLPSMTEMMRDQIRAFHGEDIPGETRAEVEARNRQQL